MKNTTNTQTTAEMSRIIAKLEKLYAFLNKEVFNDELEPVVINVQEDTTKGAYGWYSTAQVWQSVQDETLKRHEICITAEHLDRPIEETVGTLLHEMVHHYCTSNGIKDTSRNGTYHNTKFRDACIAHGLECEQGEKYGWHKTKLTEKMLKKLTSRGLMSEQFIIHRTPKVKVTRAKTTHSIKYVCPRCGASVRATKLVRIQCMVCEREMVEE